MGIAGKEKVGIPGAKSIFLLSACFLTRAHLVEKWLSEPSQRLHRKQHLAATLYGQSFLSS